MTDNVALDANLPDGRPLYAHAMMACAEGDLERLREIIAMLQPSDVAELLAFAGWSDEITLLKMACGQGNLAVVKLLVASGANPNDHGGDEDEDPEEADSTRKAPIHIAAQRGHANIVRWLVEAGADPRQLDRNGSTAYHLSCVMGCADVVRYLLDAVMNEVEVIEADGAGNTGLAWAMRQGHEDLARLLRQRGAEARWNYQVVE